MSVAFYNEKIEIKLKKMNSTDECESESESEKQAKCSSWFSIFFPLPFHIQPSQSAIWCASADDRNVNHVPRNLFTFRNDIYIWNL